MPIRKQRMNTHTKRYNDLLSAKTYFRIKGTLRFTMKGCKYALHKNIDRKIEMVATRRA